MEKLGPEHPSLECWDVKPGAFLEVFTLAPPKALLSAGSGMGAGAPTGTEREVRSSRDTLGGGGGRPKAILTLGLVSASGQLWAAPPSSGGPGKPGVRRPARAFPVGATWPCPGGGLARQPR